MCVRACVCVCVLVLVLWFSLCLCVCVWAAFLLFKIKKQLLHRILHKLNVLSHNGMRRRRRSRRSRLLFEGSWQRATTSITAPWPCCADMQPVHPQWNVAVPSPPTRAIWRYSVPPVRQPCDDSCVHPATGRPCRRNAQRAQNN